MNSTTKLLTRALLVGAAIAATPGGGTERPDAGLRFGVTRRATVASRERPARPEQAGDGSLFEELLRAQQGSDWLMVNPHPLGGRTGPGPAAPLPEADFRLAAATLQDGSACADRSAAQGARTPELPTAAKRACPVDLPAADGPKRDAALRRPMAGLAPPQTDIPELSPYLLATTAPQPPTDTAPARPERAAPPPKPPVALDDAPSFDPELQFVLDKLPKPGGPDREPASVRLLTRYAAGAVCFWCLGAFTRRPERPARRMRQPLQGAWA